MPVGHEAEGALIRIQGIPDLARPRFSQKYWQYRSHSPPQKLYFLYEFKVGCIFYFVITVVHRVISKYRDHFVKTLCQNVDQYEWWPTWWWLLMCGYHIMPRSHQTRSQYVLQNVAERGQTVCERNERCDNCLESFYELNGCFMDAMDGLQREGHSRMSRLLKILRRPPRSKIGRSDNMLKTRWTFCERNCRTSGLLGTYYNVVQSSIS